jgi:DNA gyrase subunit A
MTEGGSSEPTGPLISVEEEMQRSYLDYAMSVIVSRAIPDLRDGLKPVHRRILFSMHENGYVHNKSYKKSALIVGDVMGRYHPHGDSAIYDALVRMAQDFSMSAPLIDGQGNFGSLDNDPPAAMRYTEARLKKLAETFTADIDKNTVHFQPNYSNDREEPIVLPARYPNLLVNGAQGIAVGMATNIPPHNLGEVCDATLALIDDPALTIPDLMHIVPGPDFPTGGIIFGRSGARSAYHTGRGSVLLRAKTRIEEIRKDRFAIIVDEIPYQVNKATLVEKISELAKEKRIEGVAHVQDESNRFGVRVVVELKRDATPEVVLNQLYRFSALQTSFGCNLLALNSGRPEHLDLKKILQAFIAFREEVVYRRTAHLLSKARERAHLLCGLAVAVENVDEVVALIRGSPDPAIARERLCEKFWNAAQIRDYLLLIDDPVNKIRDDGTYKMSETQARAILDLRLQRLTALGRDEIAGELHALADKITDFLDILRSRDRILDIIRTETQDIRDAYAVPRRTEIIEHEGEVDDEDLIEREDMVVTVTHSGYIKRTPLVAYRAQKRGGKGLSAMSTKDADFVTNLFVGNTHTRVLFFCTDGMVYAMKVWRLPLANRNARGKAVVNLLPIEPGVSIAAMVPIDAPEEDWDTLRIVFATSDGDVRRNALSDFTKVKANGKIAMKLSQGVHLVDAAITDDQSDFMLTTAFGKAIRFSVTDVRVFKGRDSTGVRGIKLAQGDEVVGMTALRSVTATPGERAAYFKMRRVISGGEEDGVSLDESGEAVADVVLGQDRYAELSAHEQWILFITSRGLGKRTSALEYRVTGRGGQGVNAIDLGRGGRVVTAFPVDDDDEIMLVTNAGQAIRCAVTDVSKQSRAAGGVRILNTSADEDVVSVARMAESSDEHRDEQSGAD